MSERLSGIGFEAREVAARIYRSLRAADVPVQDAHRHISAGIPGVSVRTLQRWNLSIEQQEGLFAPTKDSGRPRVVTDEQIRILVGWILFRTDEGHIVRMADAHSFLTNQLGVYVVKETIRGHLSALGVHIGSANVSKTDVISVDEKVSTYRDSDDRIVYDGKDTDETRTFCREYGDMVRDFLEFHKETLRGEQIVFLSDNGSSFRDGSTGIVEKLGFGKHVFYPACVHQFLSPNDNSLHGVAKAKWKSLFTDFDDDVTASIALMKCLDDVSPSTIRGWWRKNLFLSGGILRESQVKDFISTRQSKWSGLHNSCVAEYITWSGMDKADVTEHNATSRRVRKGLDGEYWTK